MTTTRIPDTAAVTEARELLRLWDGRPGPLGNLLGRVTPVGKVGGEERVAALKTRSIKTSSKLWAIDLAISMVDLTTLEGKDTSGRLQRLCAKAVRPLPGDPTVPTSRRSASTRRSSPRPGRSSQGPASVWRRSRRGSRRARRSAT